MSLGDQLWFDDGNGTPSNANNGLFDSGELGVPAGVTITLVVSGTNTPIATTTTDANGNYLFTGLVPGDYQVIVTAANFQSGAAPTYAMTVITTGNGVGTVSSLPAGISCGATCSAAFATGTEVTLLASPAPGYRFSGWTGACTGAGACVVWMDNLAHVNATFAPSAVPIADNPIPTLSQWALLLLSLLMAGVAYRHLNLRAARADKTR